MLTGTMLKSSNKSNISKGTGSLAIRRKRARPLYILTASPGQPYNSAAAPRPCALVIPTPRQQQHRRNTSIASCSSSSSSYRHHRRQRSNDSMISRLASGETIQNTAAVDLDFVNLSLNSARAVSSMHHLQYVDLLPPAIPTVPNVFENRFPVIVCTVNSSACLSSARTAIAKSALFDEYEVESGDDTVSMYAGIPYYAVE